MTDITIHRFNVIDSTNSEALKNVENSKDKTVWISEFQTAGKGQRGNTWESEQGKNLTFSILFKPNNLLSTKQFALSQAVSLGIFDYLVERGLQATIKWPNDIYVKDKKICGILMENTISGDILSAGVVGIGFNLNQRNFSSDIPNPTSLILESESLEGSILLDFVPNNEFCPLLKSIMLRYDTLNKGDYDSIESEYVNALYRLGVECEYVDVKSDSTFSGEIIGVDKAARLIIKTNEGEERSFAFKELKYVI